MRAKRDSALQRAFKLVKQREIAEVLGLRATTVCAWEKCPAKHAVALEEMTKGLVKREELAPEFFRPSRSSAAE